MIRCPVAHQPPRSSVVQASDANMPVVLYYLHGASPCMFVCSVAKHIGLEVEVKDVDYYTKEHLGEEYLKVRGLAYAGPPRFLICRKWFGTLGTVHGTVQRGR